MAERSKALESGSSSSSPKGRGFESHCCQLFYYYQIWLLYGPEIACNCLVLDLPVRHLYSTVLYCLLQLRRH